jgi:hypothetical protein
MTEFATQTPTASTDPAVKTDPVVKAAAHGLLALSAMGCALLATRWVANGVQGRELWMIGALLAFALVPAIHMLHPRESGKWLGRAALGLLAVLFFVSGVSPGGSFLMWFAGSLCVYVPVLFWVFEADPVPNEDALPAELEAVLKEAA